MMSPENRLALFGIMLRRAADRGWRGISTANVGDSNDARP
jgi:hypothetical protein